MARRSLPSSMLVMTFARCILALLVLPSWAVAQTESVLYEFQGGSDGYAPSYSALVASRSGQLFGTTFDGGSSNCSGFGCGTVFELIPPQDGGTWQELVLYRFQGGADGSGPQATLVFDNFGNLYGTTSSGGTTDNGTVFQLTPPPGGNGQWTETVLYSFKGVPSGNGGGDGAYPGSLIFGSDGNLYGSTYSGGYCFTDEGGTYCYGSVYELQRPSGSGDWNETVLYRFGGYGSPGGLIHDAAGNLYGTAGGGLGVVFELSPPAHGEQWQFRAVHAFTGSPDGEFPIVGIIFDQAGNIYGTTLEGGRYNTGIAYELSPPSGGGLWNERILYSFSLDFIADYFENSLIIDSQGNLYGTIGYGTPCGSAGYTCSAVFELALSPEGSGIRTGKILYYFVGSANGYSPTGALTFGPVNHVLYGTTQYGGLSSTDCRVGSGSGTCGLVFEITPQ